MGQSDASEIHCYGVACGKPRHEWGGDGWSGMIGTFVQPPPRAELPGVLIGHLCPACSDGLSDGDAKRAARDAFVRRCRAEKWGGVLDDASAQ